MSDTSIAIALALLAGLPAATGIALVGMASGSGPEATGVHYAIIVVGALAAALLAFRIFAGLDGRENARLNAVLDALPFIVYVRDANGRFIAANKKQALHTGIDGKDFIGRSFDDIISAERRQKLMDIDDEMRRTGQPAKVEEETVTDTHGVERHFFAYRTPLENARGEMAGTVICKIDVTDLREAERSVVDHEFMFQSLIDQLPIVAAVRDLNGRYLYVNEQHAALLGSRPAAIIGKNMRDVLSPETCAMVDGFDTQIKRTGAAAPPSVETQTMADGRVGHYMAHRAPIKDAMGNIVAIASSKIDFTDVHEAQRRMWESEELLRETLDALPVIVNVRDPEGHFLFINRYQRDLMGLGDEDFSQTKIIHNAVWKKTGIAYQQTQKVIETGDATQPFDREMVDAHGKERMFMSYWVPIKAADGTVNRVIGTGIDVTQRARAERDVKESARQLEDVLDAIPVMVTLRDPEGEVVYMNKYQRSFSTLPQDQLIGKKYTHAFNWVDPGKASEQAKQVAETGEAIPPYDRGLIDRDGKRRTFMRQLNPVCDLDGRIRNVVATAIDVTDRVQAEEASEAAARQMKNVLDTIPVMVALRDAKGRIKYINKYQMSFAENPDQELTGGSNMLVFPWVDPGRGTIESREVATTRKPTPQHDRTLIDKDGVFRTFMRQVSPVFDAEGAVSDVVMTAIDVTDRVVAEREAQRLNESLENQVEARTVQLQSALDSLRDTQEQMIEQEKMASLGGLVAGVSHEINTPLGTGVTAASYLGDITRAFEQLVEGGRLRRRDITEYTQLIGDTSDVIMANLTRAAELVRSFKRVAVDQGGVANSEFALREYLEEIFRSLRPSMKKQPVDIRIDCDDGLMLRGDPGSLAQVITNLTVNAIMHGYPDGGPVSIHVSAARKPEGGIDIVFDDDGKGMTEETKSKIFEPFFTTARGQGGSGLGMHIVYNTITQVFGGTVRCESEPDKGTRFFIQLPSSADPTEQQEFNQRENINHV